MLLSKESSFAELLKRKTISPEKIEEARDRLRGERKTIATLNGSFDLLHPGHLDMIFQASLQADCLWMLLNTDASIKGYKGPHRPINPLEVRLQHIAALEMVDYVSWFDELTPIPILERICPDVHVNGSEYGENCIEAPVVKKHGGRIHIVQLVPGYSSTNLIDKICASLEK